MIEVANGHIGSVESLPIWPNLLKRQEGGEMLIADNQSSTETAETGSLITVAMVKERVGEILRMDFSDPGNFWPASLSRKVQSVGGEFERRQYKGVSYFTEAYGLVPAKFTRIFPESNELWGKGVPDNRPVAIYSLQVVGPNTESVLEIEVMDREGLTPKVEIKDRSQMGHIYKSLATEEERQKRIVEMFGLHIPQA